MPVDRLGRAYQAPWADEILQVDLVKALWPERLHRKQAAFVLGSDRYYQGYFGARGTGKTVALAQKAIVLAMANPTCEGLLCGRTGREIADKIIPNFDLQVLQIQRACGVNIVKAYYKGDQSYELINGAKIFLRPYGRPASLRLLHGYDVGWACLDEVEFAQVTASAVMGAIGHCLRSPRASMRQLAVVSSPNGLRGFPAMFRAAQEAGSKRHWCVTATVYDNPFLDPEYIENLRAGCSKRDWLAQGLGQILTPSNTVFGAEYSESTHVRPWTWRRGLPYVLAIDWGENHAFFCAIQVEPDGTWTVAHEEHHEGTTRVRFRQAIENFTDGIHRKHGDKPFLVCGDRAVFSEMSWAAMRYGTVAEAGVRKCETKDQQSLRRGLALISAQLQPIDGPPKLYLADRLSTRGPEQCGLRYALLNYRWRTDRDGVLTDVPWKDDIVDHSIDALRYALVTSAYEERLHGGKVLPFVRLENPVDYAHDRAYMRGLDTA